MMGVRNCAGVLAAMAALSVLSSLGRAAATCDASMFEVSHLRAAEHSVYNPVLGGGGTWAEIAGDELDTSTLQCRSTISYLWKLEYMGMDEGLVRAIVFVNRYEDGNMRTPLGRWLGPISSIGINPEDAVNDPVIQPTVVVSAEEIEKPDETLEDGTYYQVAVAGLVGPARAVIRIDFPIMCDGLSSENRMNLPMSAQIIKDVSVDCVETSEVSEAGVLQHQFGRMVVPVQGVPMVLVARQDPPRAGLSLNYTITTADGTCPGMGGADIFQYPAGQCELVKLCYAVSNIENSGLFNLTVIDESYTGSMRPDVEITMTSTSVPVGGTVYGEALFYPSQFPGLVTWKASAFALSLTTNLPVSEASFILSAAVGSELCQCVEDGVVDSQKFICDFAQGVDVGCTAEPSQYTNYRCTDDLEPSTHTCIYSEVSRCRLRADAIPGTAGGSYFCDVTTAGSVSAVLNGGDCYNGTYPF